MPAHKLVAAALGLALAIAAPLSPSAQEAQERPNHPLRLLPKHHLSLERLQDRAPFFRSQRLQQLSNAAAMIASMCRCFQFPDGWRLWGQPPPNRGGPDRSCCGSPAAMSVSILPHTARQGVLPV